MSMFVCARCDSIRDSDDGCEEAPASKYHPPHQLLCAECVDEAEDERDYAADLMTDGARLEAHEYAKTIAALLSSSAAERAVVEALEEAAKVAEADCTPGYGQHRDDMEHLAANQRRNIAYRIRALSSVRGEGGDKQATRREDAATAPISTDTKGTTK